MLKIEAILDVYGKLKKSVFVGDEEITGWKIVNVNKRDLLKQFTHEEILIIYESGV